MHLTGLVKSEILILYIPLIIMVTETLTHEMGKLSSSLSSSLSSTNSYAYTKGIMTKMKKISEHDRLNQIATLQRIWTKVRGARHRMQKQKDTILTYYKHVRPFSKGIDYDWLPQGHLSLFENEIRHLDKHLKIKRMIPILYSSLEIYLSTFEEMMSIHEARLPSDYLTRKEILEPIRKDLNSTKEEVETAVEIFELPQPITDVIALNKTKDPDVKESHTFIMVHDWGVITMYYRFIKEWEKITKKVFADYCNTITKTHQCHKFLSSMTDSTTQTTKTV